MRDSSCRFLNARRSRAARRQEEFQKQKEKRFGLKAKEFNHKSGLKFGVESKNNELKINFLLEKRKIKNIALFGEKMAIDLREGMVPNWPDVQKDQKKARQIQVFCATLSLIITLALLLV